MRKALLITLLVLLGAVNAAAGPADPPTLPALPEPGQVVGISRFSVADIQELPTPGNPPTGYLRLYADSGTEQLKCLTSAGASCLSSGGGSSAFSSLTSGTNTTATMVVGSGASLGVSGTGTISATSCGGTTTQVLFNDGGVCASSASLAFNKTLATLGVGVGFSDGTLSSDIGFTSSANSPISLLAGTHITDTVNSSNHFPAGGGLACEYTGSATLSNSSCNGFYAQGLMNGTGTMAQVTGMNAFGFNEAGTLTGGPVGAEITAENDATALNAIGIINGASNFGTITGKLEGIETGAEIDGGTVATMIGLEIQNIKAAGTVTGSNTGLLIDDLHGISAVANYGIHIVNLGTAATDWAIKVDGGKSEFGGPIILDGLTSGSATLGVADVAGTPNRINLPIATGAAGNLLVTDGASPQQAAWSTGLTWANSTKSLIASGGTGATSGILAGSNALSVSGSAASNAITLTAFATSATATVGADQALLLQSVNSQIRLGNVGGSNQTVLRFLGNTSGNADIGVAAAAGSPNPINLPTATGSSGNCLKTDGANPQQTSWGTCSTTTGTVTSVATSSPLGGGTITSTGTITCTTCLTATTPTNHGVLLGAGTQAVGATAAPATANEPLVSGASADPTFLPYAIPATIAAHQTLVATSTTVVAAKTIPDCTDTTGNHLNYTQSSDAYSCGTSDITQNTPAVVGKSITAYNSTTGAFTQSNGICAPQFSSTDTLTAAGATANAETVFATQCSIAANTIIAGTVIRGVVGIDWTATATVPNFTFKVKLCTVSGCGSGTVVNIYNSTVTAPTAGTFSTSLPILIQGTAAAGAAVTIAQAINVGTGANSPAGRNSVAGLVANVPTNATLFLQFSATFSTQAATNSMTVTSLTFAP